MVSDPSTLGAIVRNALDEGSETNQTKAAKKCGISQPTLSRLIGGRAKALSERTLRALVDLVGPDRERALFAAVCNAAERRRLETYWDWLQFEHKRVSCVSSRNSGTEFL